MSPAFCRWEQRRPQRRRVCEDPGKRGGALPAAARLCGTGRAACERRQLALQHRRCLCAIKRTTLMHYHAQYLNNPNAVLCAVPHLQLLLKRQLRALELQRRLLHADGAARRARAEEKQVVRRARGCVRVGEGSQPRRTHPSSANARAAPGPPLAHPPEQRKRPRCVRPPTGAPTSAAQSATRPPCAPPPWS